MDVALEKVKRVSIQVGGKEMTFKGITSSSYDELSRTVTFSIKPRSKMDIRDIEKRSDRGG